MQYSLNIFPFMKLRGPQTYVTETEVSVPPALHITDEEGARWTLGFDYDEVSWRSGKYEYDVVRNGEVTGQYARIIEYKPNSRGTKVIRIWGADGWRAWNGRQFV